MIKELLKHDQIEVRSFERKTRFRSGIFEFWWEKWIWMMILWSRSEEKWFSKLDLFSELKRIKELRESDGFYKERESDLPNEEEERQQRFKLRNPIDCLS